MKTDLETWAKTLIPAGINTKDLKDGTAQYFDHYLDGKKVSAPEEAPKTEKPRKKET